MIVVSKPANRMNSENLERATIEAKALINSEMSKWKDLDVYFFAKEWNSEKFLKKLAEDECFAERLNSENSPFREIASKNPIEALTRHYLIMDKATSSALYHDRLVFWSTISKHSQNASQLYEDMKREIIDNNDMCTIIDNEIMMNERRCIDRAIDGLEYSSEMKLLKEAVSKRRTHYQHLLVELDEKFEDSIFWNSVEGQYDGIPIYMEFMYEQLVRKKVANMLSEIGFPIFAQMITSNGCSLSKTMFVANTIEKGNDMLMRIGHNLPCLHKYAIGLANSKEHCHLRAELQIWLMRSAFAERLGRKRQAKRLKFMASVVASNLERFVENLEMEIDRVGYLMLIGNEVNVAFMSRMSLMTILKSSAKTLKRRVLCLFK